VWRSKDEAENGRLFRQRDLPDLSYLLEITHLDIM
jgi:hypothetical protein